VGEGLSSLSAGLAIILCSVPVSYTLLQLQVLSSSFHHSQSSSSHLLGEGREQSIVSVSERSSHVAGSTIRRSVPDEAGPRVAAGVAKVDDQGKVAVVNGDLGEANDASDALLFDIFVSMRTRWGQEFAGLPRWNITGASDRGWRTLVSSENCSQAIVSCVVCGVRFVDLI